LKIGPHLKKREGVWVYSVAKFYITTSIPYVNAAPHIGNVLDSVYADVLARYKRQHNFDVRFLTGADEHGAKISRSAAANWVTPQQFVDENSAKFKNLKKVLNLSWDDFIRTSDRQRHWPGAQKLWRALKEKGDLYKKIYKGLYCVGHEAFITEKDLVDGKCWDHQKAPEVIEEENWFFKLSKYTKEIEAKIKAGELKVVPEGRAHEILGLLKEGLEDISFSRPAKDLSWGVPVPDDDTQTMYVWAEALISYISALGYGSANEADFKKYWPADVQVVGKDNLRFHAAIWPGMLLSAGLPLPKTLFAHGFLTVGGQKISKTVGNVIDPVELVNKYGADAVRYYLLREVPPFDDGDFSYEKFEERYNADLANGIGNFAARVLTLGEKLGEIPADKEKVKPAVEEKIKITRAEVEEKLAAFKFHEALATIWGLITFGDEYVNKEQPWKQAEGAAMDIIFNLVVVLDNVASLLQPFVPNVAQEITEAIHWTPAKTLKLSKLRILFPRIV